MQLSACSKQNALKLLNELRSENESSSLEVYNRNHTIKVNDEIRYISMIFNEEEKNFIMTSYSDTNQIQIASSDRQIVEDFFNNFYFITKEKLSVLFPLNNIKYESLSRNCIVIKKYDSKSDYYYTFKYGNYKNFLFLESYKDNIIDDYSTYLFF